MKFSFPSKRNVSRSRHGFTLVELLVVIGIIALLISILLPSLNNARRSSQVVKCLSNLRQLGQAFSLYVIDSKGVLPPITYEGNPNGGFWPNPLTASRYLRAASNSIVSSRPNTNSVFFCPSDDATPRSNNGNTSIFNLTTTGNSAQTMNFRGAEFVRDSNDIVTTNYAANGIQAYSFNFTSLVNGRPISEFFPFVTVPTNATFVRPNAKKLSSAKESSRLVLLFDGVFCHDRNPAFFVLRHGNPARGLNQTSSNYLLADGHCESLKAVEQPNTGLDGFLDNNELTTSAQGRWPVKFTVSPVR